MNRNKELKALICYLIIPLLTSVVFVLPASASTTNGTIDSTNKYAWGENIGWINFGTTAGNVHITDSGITGSALSETVGWINLENVVNDGEGNLSGYAWGENIGWINFDPVNGGVVINSSGEFTGSALSENMGWIIFGGDYKVKTDWRAQTLRPACNNTIDDDGDGLADYPSDPGCSDLNDDNEVNGSVFVAPPKPNIQNVSVALDGERLEFKNLPANIIQMAVSLTSDFNNASWEDIAKKDEILNRYASADKFYIKLRTDRGAVSDMMTYEPNSSQKPMAISDGDIVKTLNNPDVYVIKIKNNKKYKRLILSPSVFKSYQHLKWDNLKIISQTEMNQYATSSLVKETKDSTIYELMPNGDTGTKQIYATYINGIPHLVRDDNAVQDYILDGVYEINAVDRDSYKLVK